MNLVFPPWILCVRSIKEDLKHDNRSLRLTSALEVCIRMYALFVEAFTQSRSSTVRRNPRLRHTDILSWQPFYSLPIFLSCPSDPIMPLPISIQVNSSGQPQAKIFQTIPLIAKLIEGFHKNFYKRLHIFSYFLSLIFESLTFLVVITGELNLGVFRSLRLVSYLCHTLYKVFLSSSSRVL